MDKSTPMTGLADKGHEPLTLLLWDNPAWRSAWLSAKAIHWYP